jgi:hypothetical protein
LLVVFLGALGVTVYKGQEGTKAGGDLIRATKLAEQTLEGARDIGTRHYNDGAGSLFSAVGAGNKGVTLNPATGLWEFSGTQTTTDNYTTSLVVTQPSAGDTDTVDLTVTTTWFIAPNRPKSLTLTGRFTNWRQKKDVGNWGAGIQVLGQYNPGGTPDFNDVAVVGDYAYLTDGAGHSVTIVNIANVSAMSSPGSIDMGAVTPVAIAAKGTTLYIIGTDVSGSHVYAYNASNPTNPVLVASQDIPVIAGMNATSLVVAGDFLYVGAK